jgi:hypothetical protein
MYVLCTSVYVCIYMYVCIIYVCILYVCVFVGMYVYMYVCIIMYVCMHPFHTQKRRSYNIHQTTFTRTNAETTTSTKPLS